MILAGGQATRDTAAKLSFVSAQRKKRRELFRGSWSMAGSIVAHPTFAQGRFRALNYRPNPDWWLKPG
jgi:hypothetical protein